MSTADNMTLADLRTKRAEVEHSLQREIAFVVREFQEETGLPIASVSVEVQPNHVLRPNDNGYGVVGRVHVGIALEEWP